MATGRTFGTLIAEARTLLQDKVPTVDGQLRTSDAEHFEAINGFMAEVRTKRPDLFLPMGLRTDLPFYAAPTDMTTAFPLDLQAYQAMLYYVAGRAELKDDTFADDARAVTLLNKAVSQLLTVQS
jgi:hypothetical protein